MLIDKNNKIKSNYTNKNCVSLQHEANYYLLGLLIPNKLFEGFNYQCTVKGKPQLIIKVVNKYKYTLELELCYLFGFGESENILIKLYQDAKVAEVVYCTDLQRFIRMMGPKISPKLHKQTRSVLNNFLTRWLNYLLKNNYSKNKWQVISSKSD